MDVVENAPNAKVVKAFGLCAPSPTRLKRSPLPTVESLHTLATGLDTIGWLCRYESLCLFKTYEMSP